MHATATLLTVLGILCPAALLAEEPGIDLPAIPPLIAPSDNHEGPKSFIVDGTYQTSPSTGIAFRFVTDGAREFCAVFDAANGTPLFLSDGRQTLVYYVTESRVVLVPLSRTAVSIDWVAGNEKPFHFNTGAVFNPKVEKLAMTPSHFRIDRFASDRRSAMSREQIAGGTAVFRAERAQGIVEMIRWNPEDPTCFGFVSAHADSDIRVEMNATSIGQPIPEHTFSFPDVTALENEVPVASLEPKLLPAGKFLTGGGWIPKMMAMLAVDAHDPKVWESIRVDAEDIRRRDHEFGPRYRAALAKQGFTFTPLGGTLAVPTRLPVVAEKPAARH